MGEKRQESKGKSKSRKFCEQRYGEAFLDRKGVILTRYMPRGITINADTYCQVLQDLCMAIWGKCPRWQSKFILLLHGNAHAHSAIKMQNLLRQCNQMMFEHPMYSPDLTFSDYHLFPELKKCHSGQHFADDTELIIFINSYLPKTSLFYKHGICKRFSRYEKCLNCQENYAEKIHDICRPHKL